MQTPLRALVHFLTVGWKKHMPGVKRRATGITLLKLSNSIKKPHSLYKFEILGSYQRFQNCDGDIGAS